MGGQRHVCTFRLAQRAAYRTAISAAQTCFTIFHTVGRKLAKCYQRTYRRRSGIRSLVLFCYRRLASALLHSAGSATYQLPIPNPNPKTHSNPNPLELKKARALFLSSGTR